MEHIFELFFRGIIANTLGLYTRYLFFLLIGKKQSLKYLSGEETKDQIDKVPHIFINTTIGLIVFIPIVIGIAKLLDVLGLL